MTLTILRPGPEHLPGYIDALERGWSPDNTAGGEATRLAQLAAITQNPAAFLAGLDDPGAKGGDIRLPDGSLVQRLPGFVRWLWDGAFCGAIGFRWRPGTEELPPHVLGHIGYAVVPWKRGRRYATQALGLLLPEARARGLRWVILTTDPGNIASQRVIQANGGVLEGPFEKPEAFGGGQGLRWRIDIP
jgi:predicted acetyltransferase